MAAIRIKKKKKKQKERSTKSKFQRRDEGVLKKTFKERDTRMRTTGQSIFKHDGLPEFSPEGSEKGKENNVFIGPHGFEASTGLHREILVHFSVGPAGNDQYICLQGYLNKPCPICEYQQKKIAAWRKKTGGGKENWDKALTPLFPGGCVIYIVLNVDDLEKGWQLWRAGKEKVHSEIMARTHPKKEQEFIDISDMEEGRIVNFQCIRRRGDYPKYKAFDLIELDEPIPSEYQSALEDIVNEGEDEGGTIEQFLHIPTYDEVKEAFYRGIDEKQPTSDEDADDEDEDDTEDEFDEEELREELDGMNKFQLKKWAKGHGIALAIMGQDADDLVDEIVSEFEERSERPSCFGEAHDHEDCPDCDWLDPECTEEAEKRLED